MITTDILNVNGKDVQAVCITSPGGQGHPNMLVLLARKGYIMCGYLNQEAAKSFGDAACVISGTCFDELLANPVKAVTPEAEALGVQTGMTGAQACAILNG